MWGRVLKLWVCVLIPEMIELDGDEERISSQGRLAERDIVQVGHPGNSAQGWGAEGRRAPPLVHGPEGSGGAHHRLTDSGSLVVIHHSTHLHVVKLHS